ncbi:MAG TPA: hypothetical protein VL360_08890 [Gammaproteobacteria bacterium]|jgi:tetratricopeptide (TPR) repeat protein|nr:hypothetical protein [Gammaproteobacteria bacterium]
MRLRYPHLSSGYIGCDHDQQTLNAKYHGNFSGACMDHVFCLDDIILFPQRIPRMGFFIELYQNETDEFRDAFTKHRSHLKDYLINTAKIANLKANESISRFYINWANLCVRYGLFNEVINNPLIRQFNAVELEAMTMKESAKIDFMLSTGKPVNIGGYLDLAETYIPKHSNEREQIILLNQLIVTYYRHQKSTRSKKVFKYAKDFLSLLEKYESNNLHNQLYCSMGYRGLAMVKEFSFDLQNEFLNKAEFLAMAAKTDHDYHEPVVLENQQICFQSIAKWHLQNGDMKNAEKYLNQMVMVDPYDSTGHSELGLFLIKLEAFEEAGKCFKKAMELGPPGAGMNAYYYAQCLINLGKETDAVDYFKKAAELDPLSISPLLDLLDYYNAKGDQSKANDIVNYIMKHDHLSEQLEAHEIKKMQTSIH